MKTFGPRADDHSEESVHFNFRHCIIYTSIIMSLNLIRTISVDGRSDRRRDGKTSVSKSSNDIVGLGLRKDTGEGLVDGVIQPVQKTGIGFGRSSTLPVSLSSRGDSQSDSLATRATSAMRSLFSIRSRKQASHRSTPSISFPPSDPSQERNGLVSTSVAEPTDATTSTDAQDPSSLSANSKGRGRSWSRSSRSSNAQSRGRSRSQDTVGPLKSNRSVADTESVIGSEGTSSPWTSEDEDDSNAVEEDDASVISDSDLLHDDLTEENTHLNSQIPHTEDDDPLALLPAIIDEGPNVIRPASPHFHSQHTNLRSARDKLLPLQTDKPVHERDRCSIVITQGTPESVEQSADNKEVIMIASDLSEEAQYAIDWGIGTVMRDGGELWVVSVMESDSKRSFKFTTADLFLIPLLSRCRSWGQAGSAGEAQSSEAG